MPETGNALPATRPYAERLIRPLVTIRRARTLAYPGHVVQSLNDRVAADSVVVEADVPQGYRLIELDKELGRRGARRGGARFARKAMVRRIGDVVEQGEPLARWGGLFKREYTSPVAGQIIDIRGTRVLIEAIPQRIELLALYPGQVVDLVSDRGVVIETTGTLVQGAWGYGRAQRGVLLAAVPAGDASLLVGQITSEHMGAVLLGGRTLEADVIAQAIEARVRGVIVGSIHADLIPLVVKSGLSVIVTEGFGDIPMHPAAFEYLYSCIDQEVCFQPSTGVDWRTQRPEVFCFVAGQERPALLQAQEAINLGDRARVLRAPYDSAIGEIVSLPDQPRRLDSGIIAWGAEVDLASAGVVFVPLENLEIIREKEEHNL